MFHWADALQRWPPFLVMAKDQVHYSSHYHVTCVTYEKESITFHFYALHFDYLREQKVHKFSWITNKDVGYICIA